MSRNKINTTRVVTRSPSSRATGRAGGCGGVEPLERRTLFAAVAPGLGFYRPGAGVARFDNDRNGVVDQHVAFPTQAGDQVVSADFGGTTRSTLAIYRHGQWLIDVNGDGVPDRVVNFGGAKGIAVAADFNGDGVADLAIYNPSTGVWRIDTDQNGQVARQFTFGGQAGDVPLAGDFDFSGTADPVIYNAGTWRVSTAGDGTVSQTYHFGGAAGDVPVLADVTSLGVPTLAVFNAGNWAFDTDRDGVADIGYRLGRAGDVPLAGYFGVANSVFVRIGGSDATGDGSFTNPVATIGRAVALAPDNAFIRIGAGTYAENVMVRVRTGLAFVGAGMTATRIASPGGDALFLDRCTSIDVAGMTVSGGGSDGRGVIVLGSSVRLRDVSTAGSATVGLVAGQNPYAQTTRNHINARASRFDQTATGDGMDLNDTTDAVLRHDRFDLNGTDPAGIPGGINGGRGLVVANGSTTDIRGSDFSANYNGGLYGISSSTIAVTGSTFIGNRYGDGALFLDHTIVTVFNSLFQQNGLIRGPAQGLNGLEFLHDSFDGTATLSGNTFRNNTGFGAFVGSGHVDVTDNTFDDNSVGLGIYGDGGTAASATVTGNLFTVPVGSVSEEGVFGEGPNASAVIGGSAVADHNTFRNFNAQRSIHADRGTNDAPLPAGGAKFTVFGNNYINSPDPLRNVTQS